MVTYRTPLALASVFTVIVACGGASAPVASAPEPAAGGCTTSGARACRDANDCGPELHCTGGRCFANLAGCPCSESSECGASAHCTQGTCYANTSGVPCSAPSDCGPRAHCTAGGCYANTTGSPCSSTADCGPASSCVGGTCN